jgi:hydrogenase maturation protease
MASRTLIYGIGNISRQDDGLGIRFVELLEKMDLPEHIQLESCFQLNAEDSLIISEYDRVYFVDASQKNHEKGFEISPLKSSNEISFSTHAMKPASVLAFCHELYEKNPETFLVAIQGSEWELGEELSESSQKNLQACMDEICKELEISRA